MRYLFVLLLVFHGLIHLMGFVKAFKWAEMSQLTQPISKGIGIVWLVSALLFLLAALLYFSQKDYWWMAGALAVLFSQWLILSSWQDAKMGTIANALILLGLLAGFGTWNFSRGYKTDIQQGLNTVSGRTPALLTEADLMSLPTPVQRYLRYSGVVGKPKVTHFKVCFDGKIRKNEQSEWMPFTSEQFNFMEPASRCFLMKATMKGLPVGGYHKFDNSGAFMDIRLFSLVPVQYQGNKEMQVAETVTFFNDMCCMAPATLIDQRIQWLETAGNNVKATFTNQGITITAWLYFNDQGQLINFTSEDRFAAGEDQIMRQIPWSTPLQNYQSIHEGQHPGYAETIYHYPEGQLCYGTFQLTGLAYNPTSK